MAGHLDDSLQEYAEVLNTTLTQTRVLGLINQHIEDDAIVVGAAGSLPGDLQRLWQVKRQTPIILNTVIHAWAMKSLPPSGRKLRCHINRCTPWWVMAPI